MVDSRGQQKGGSHSEKDKNPRKRNKQGGPSARGGLYWRQLSWCAIPLVVVGIFFGVFLCVGIDWGMFLVGMTLLALGAVAWLRGYDRKVLDGVTVGRCILQPRTGAWVANPRVQLQWSLRSAVTDD